MAIVEMSAIKKSIGLGRPAYTATEKDYPIPTCIGRSSVHLNKSINVIFGNYNISGIANASFNPLVIIIGNVSTIHGVSTLNINKILNYVISSSIKINGRGSVNLENTLNIIYGQFDKMGGVGSLTVDDILIMLAWDIISGEDINWSGESHSNLNWS